MLDLAAVRWMPIVQDVENALDCLFRMPSLAAQNEAIEHMVSTSGVADLSFAFVLTKLREIHNSIAAILRRLTERDLGAVGARRSARR